METISQNKNDLLNNTVVAFICLFPFIKVNALGGSNTPIHLGLFLVCTFILVIAYLILRRWKPGIELYPVLFSFSILFSSLSYDKKYAIWAIIYGSRLIVFFIVVKLYMENRRFLILDVFDGYLTILFLLNLFFQIFDRNLFGRGANINNYLNFFIDDNAIVFYAIPYITVVLLRYIKGVTSYFVSVLVKIIVVCASIFSARAVGGIISIVLYMVVLIGVATGIVKFNKKIFVSTVIIMNLVLIMGGRIIPYIDRYLIRLFGKQIGRSRALIWNAALGNFLRNPVFGYGTRENARNIMNFDGHATWYSHNFILEIGIQGGIIALVIFVIFILYAVNKNDSNPNSLVKNILYCGMLGVFLSFLTEGTIFDPIEYFVFILCCFSDSLYEYNQCDISLVQMESSN